MKGKKVNIHDNNYQQMLQKMGNFKHQLRKQPSNDFNNSVHPSDDFYQIIVSKASTPNPR